MYINRDPQQQSKRRQLGPGTGFRNVALRGYVKDRFGGNKPGNKHNQVSVSPTNVVSLSGLGHCGCDDKNSCSCGSGMGSIGDSISSTFSSITSKLSRLSIVEMIALGGAAILVLPHVFNTRRR